MSSEALTGTVKFPENEEANTAEVVDGWRKGTEELKMHLQVAQSMIKKRKRGLSQIIRAMNREEDGCDEDDYDGESYYEEEDEDEEQEEGKGWEPPEPASTYHEKYGMNGKKLEALIEEIKSVESLVKDLKATEEDSSGNEDIPR